MEKSEAIKTLRIYLRPSVGTMKMVATEGNYNYIHTCKKSSTVIRLIEAITMIGGKIISQEETDDGFVTLASLPPTSINLITPGPWGGSKPGRTYKKSEDTASRKLDVRLYDHQAKMLKALGQKWFDPERKTTTSKTIRRLIEEAAEREGIT